MFLNNYYTLTIETANYLFRELNLKRNSPYGGRERWKMCSNNVIIILKCVIRHYIQKALKNLKLLIYQKKCVIINYVKKRQKKV